MAEDHAAKIAQAEDVFEQASVEGVMHDFGRGRALQSRNNFRVLHHAVEKLPQPGIFHRCDDFEQLGVHLVHIFLVWAKKSAGSTSLSSARRIFSMASWSLFR